MLDVRWTDEPRPTRPRHQTRSLSTPPRSVTALVEPARAPDLAPERESPLELRADLRPRSALQRVCSIARRTRLMRSHGCQRWASVSFISPSAPGLSVRRVSSLALLGGRSLHVDRSCASV